MVLERFDFLAGEGPAVNRVGFAGGGREEGLFGGRDLGEEFLAGPDAHDHANSTGLFAGSRH